MLEVVLSLDVEEVIFVMVIRRRRLLMTSVRFVNLSDRNVVIVSSTPDRRFLRCSRSHVLQLNRLRESLIESIRPMQSGVMLFTLSGVCMNVSMVVKRASCKL